MNDRVSDGDRRRQILEAASRLVRHYGPFKTTVADIAKEARVGVGTVYLEFRNKDAILGALSESRHERVLRAVEHAWGDGHPAPARLERALAARVDAFLACADGAHGRDLIGCSCPAVADAYHAFRASEHALFVRFLRAGSSSGALAVSDPDADARGLLLAYHAFEPPLLFERSIDDVRRDLSRLHRIVLVGLLPRPG